MAALGAQEEAEVEEEESGARREEGQEVVAEAVAVSVDRLGAEEARLEGPRAGPGEGMVAATRVEEAGGLVVMVAMAAEAGGAQTEVGQGEH